MSVTTRVLSAAVAAGALLGAPSARAQHWATVWAGAAQGPFPAGIQAAQPPLDFAFPHPASGSHEQSFRLVIKPDLFGRQMRFRFSNAFGSKPVTFDTAFVGLQMSGAAVVPGTNRPLLFAGKPTVTVPPGAEVWSDAVLLPFVHDQAPELAGRKLALTFHIPGDSGPMTWHAMAMTSSYVTAPDAGAVGQLEDDSAYPFSTTSWFFLDAADAAVPPDTHVIVCLGDGSTDGANSTLNGDDRWTDVLSRRLQADGDHVAVVNEGIAGNQVAGPATYDPAQALPGGPSAVARLDRDVLGLSGVTDVIVAEGAGDLAAKTSPTAVTQAMRGLIDRIRAKFKGVKLAGATLTGGGSGAEGRRQLNELIRAPGFFDAVVDFEAATTDLETGNPRAEFAAPSAGGASYPNRAGYLAMGGAVDLRALVPPPRPRPRPRPVAAPTPDDAAAPQTPPQ